MSILGYDQIIRVDTFSSMPTNVNNGSLAFAVDTGRHYMFSGGAWYSVQYGQFYTNTVTATLTNTASEASLLPSGTSNHTILANTCVAGTTFNLSGGGIYTTPGGAADITLRIKIGSTVLCSVVTTALLNNVANYAMEFYGFIKILGTTGSFTAVAGGRVLYRVTGSAIPVCDFLSQTTPASVDLSTNQVLDITGQWDSANTNRSATIQNATILRIN